MVVTITLTPGFLPSILFTFGAEYFFVGTAVLCVVGCFSSIPGLCGLDASRCLPSPTVPTKKHLWTFSNIPQGTKLTLGWEPWVHNHFLFHLSPFPLPSPQELLEALGDLCIILALKEKPLGCNHFPAASTVDVSQRLFPQPAHLKAIALLWVQPSAR